MNLFKEVEGQDMIESEMKVIPAILSGKVIIIHKLEKFGHFGMIPILTMIPVRENSEVVIICPDIILCFCLGKECPIPSTRGP